MDPQRLTPTDILSLQGTLGNHRVQRLLSASGKSGVPTIQREVESNLLSEEDTALGEGESPGFDLLGQQEDLTLDPEEALPPEGESPGFTIPDTMPPLPMPPLPKTPTARYQRPEPAPKPKKTLKQKLNRVGKGLKGFAKGQTVHSYGKMGVHALMSRDERMLGKAARLLDSDDPADLRTAQQILQFGIYRVTKQGPGEISSFPKGLAVALVMPIWFSRFTVAHLRWKSLAKKAGLIGGKSETPEPEPTAPEPESQPWQRAGVNYKDEFGALHAWMSGSGRKGQGLSLRDKKRVQDKWRLREMSNPDIALGKQRNEGWHEAYARSGRRGESPSGIKVGRHRPEWRNAIKKLDPQSKFKVGGHRPVWGFDKPTGKQGKPGLGGHRPVWGFNKPTGGPGSRLVGGHRPIWDYRGGGTAKMKAGGHRPVWGFDAPGGDRSTRSKFANHRRGWGFDKPEGDKSGLTLGNHRPEWGFDKPGGSQGSSGLGTHRAPVTWQETSAKMLYPPNSVPPLGAHRLPELPSVPEPEETVTPTQDAPTPEETVNTPQESSGLQVGGIYTLQQPLSVVNPWSGNVQTIPAGIQVYIAELTGENARVDGMNRASGHAPLNQVKAALGM